MMQRWNRNPAASHQRSGQEKKSSHGADPYFRWAKETLWRSYVDNVPGSASESLSPEAEPQRVVRVLAQASSRDQFKAVLDDCDWTIPEMYREDFADKARTTFWFTANVSSGLLLTNEHDLRWELSAPVRDTELTARADRLGEFGETRDIETFSRGIELISEVRSKNSRDGFPKLSSAIAVIDFGCPFINDRFCKGAGTWSKAATRLEAIWDQGGDAKKAGARAPWSKEAPPSTGYGRELLKESVQRVIGVVRSDMTNVDELDAYRAMDHLIDYDDPRRRSWAATHGAHVLDMAGGRDDPITTLKDNSSKAPLVFIQLPSLTAADSSGGSLAAQLLDAVRYAMSLCPGKAPLVINISYGTFAGPHDGSSMIEEALDDLLETRPDNFAIVLSAGNARQAACHVQRTVRPNQSALLRMDLVPNDTTDTFVEVWYDKDVPQGWELRARVRTSERQWSNWVAVGQQDLLLEASVGEPVAMLRHDRTVPNGRRSMILLAVRPTRPPMGDIGPAASAGCWEIEISLARNNGSVATESDGSTGTRTHSSGGGDVGVIIDAWIERDDPGDSDMVGQSSFAGVQLQDADETLSSLATGKHTIIVGGFRRSDATPMAYSSIGKKAAGLFVHAACEEDEFTAGIRAAAVRSNASSLMNGTSVAAPVVVRRLYNFMLAKKGRAVKRGDWPAVLAAIIKEEHDPKNPRASQAVKRSSATGC